MIIQRGKVQHINSIYECSGVRDWSAVIDGGVEQLSDHMLALDDTTLSQMANVGKCTEAFIKGWHVFKQGNEEQMLQIVMST